jgi:hypothetical protein
MRDEREQKRDDAEPGVQSRRDQQFRETEQPDKTLSREGLASRALDFPTKRAALTRARSAGPLGNMPDMILLGFSAGILLREESVDKQKSILPVQEK